jgi:hypothetical protein
MTVVIPPDFAEVSIELRNEGDPDSWYVTWGIDITAGSSDYNMAAVKCGTVFSQAFKADLTPRTTIVGAHLRIGQADGPPLVVFQPNGDVGTSSGAHLPQNCALLVTKITPLGGRRGKGRMFLPGVLVDSAVNEVGVIQTDVLVALQSDCDVLYNGLGDELQGGPLPMVLLHNDGLTEAPGPTVITGLQAKGTISTQRGRLR